MHINTQLDLASLQIDTSFYNLEARRREIARTVERAKQVLKSYHRQTMLERLDHAHTCCETLLHL